MTSKTVFFIYKRRQAISGFPQLKPAFLSATSSATGDVTVAGSRWLEARKGSERANVLGHIELVRPDVPLFVAELDATLRLASEQRVIAERSRDGGPASWADAASPRQTPPTSNNARAN